MFFFGCFEGKAMQLKYTSLLLTAFLALASAQTYGQEKDLLSADYSKCIEQSGGTDSAMLDCMGAEAERQDKKLNDVYTKLMNQLTRLGRSSCRKPNEFGSSILRQTAISILIQTVEPQPG